jgi:hypothetical protein
MKDLLTILPGRQGESVSVATRIERTQKHRFSTEETKAMIEDYAKKTSWRSIVWQKSMDAIGAPLASI